MSFMFVDETNVNNQVFQSVDDITLKETREMLEEIRLRGDELILKHSISLGDVISGEQVVLNRHVLHQSFQQITHDQRKVLVQIAQTVYKFVQGTVQNLSKKHLSTVGCYISQECSIFPKATILPVLLAKLSGAETVVVSSRKPSSILLATAYVAGADYFLKLGGVQSIAALVFGLTCPVTSTEIAKADYIFGFGSKWVAAAKEICSEEFDLVNVDFVGGSNQLLLIIEAEMYIKNLVFRVIKALKSDHYLELKLFIISFSKKVLEVAIKELKSIRKDVFTRIKVESVCILSKSVESCMSLVSKLHPESYNIYGSEEFVNKVQNSLDVNNFLGGYFDSVKDSISA